MSLKLLEACAGENQSWSKAGRALGFECTTLDWNTKIPGIDLYEDVRTFEPTGLRCGVLLPRLPRDFPSPQQEGGPGLRGRGWRSVPASVLTRSCAGRHWHPREPPRGAREAALHAGL